MGPRDKKTEIKIGPLKVHKLLESVRNSPYQPGRFLCLNFRSISPQAAACGPLAAAGAVAVAAALVAEDGLAEHAPQTKSRNWHSRHLLETTPQDNAPTNHNMNDYRYPDDTTDSMLETGSTDLIDATDEW